jgi:hypothetical protein
MPKLFAASRRETDAMSQTEHIVIERDKRGGQPKATRAYVWSYERTDGKRRFFAVLHTPPIMSPRDAARAAIVAEARDGK